jgi:hypothetical protein
VCNGRPDHPIQHGDTEQPEQHRSQDPVHGMRSDERRGRLRAGMRRPSAAGSDLISGGGRESNPPHLDVGSQQFEDRASGRT